MRPTVPGLLVPVLWAFLVPGLWGETDWRVSDPLGSDVGPSLHGKGTKGWVLRIESADGTESRTLFHDGEEDSVRLVDLGEGGRVLRVRDLRGGHLLWAVSYDPTTSLPDTETSYEDDQSVEAAALEFQDGVLVRRTVRDGAGTLLYTDTLGRWPDGTLRRLERDGPEGPLAEAAWSYGPGRALSGAWLADGENKAAGQHREWVYGALKTEEALVQGVDALETRVTEWLEAGASRETRTDKAGAKVESLVKDGQGRVTEDVVKVKDAVVQTRRWTYDDQGRITETSTESAGPRELWSYQYNEGTVLGRLFRGEVLSREEVTRDGEKSEVRYYDHGAVFLVETWTGGRKTKEAYYQKGVLVRERAP